MKYFKLKFLLIFAALAMAIPPAWAETVTDVITAEGIGVTTTTYTSWSNKSFTSDAVYAGMTARKTISNKYYIQVNKGSTTNGYGLVSTTSGGKVKSITITINTNSTDGGKFIDIYGKNTAYTASTDLYNSTTQGTRISEVSTGNATTTITPTDDYEYIGIRARTNVAYITDITIVWEIPDTGAPYITVDPKMTINDATGDDKTGTLTATLTNGQGDLSAATTPSDKWSWNNNTVTFNGKELGAEGTVTFSSTNATDVTADLEYNYTGPLYILGTVNGWTSWGANNAVEIAEPDANGIYTVTLTTAAGEQGMSWISFSKRVAENNDDGGWAYIAPYRFSLQGDNVNTAYWLTEDKIGTWIDLDFDPDHAGNQPLRMDAGTYNITIDAKNNKFKIERYEVPVPKIYNKVVHESQLIAGKKYILVNEDKKKYCGEITLSGSNYIGYAVDGPDTSEGSVDIYGYNDIKELTLGYDEAWTFHNGDGYLHYPGGNQLNVVSEIENGQAKWTVSSSDDGFILTNAYNTDRVLQYNSSSPRFACYTGSQQPAVLYVEDGVEPSVLPTVATPTFTPAAGTYTEVQNVEINCTTEDATIYYTTDGTVPTTASAVYSTAIEVAQNMTIKAMAVKDGMTNSNVATAEYTINLPITVSTLAAANALEDDTEFTFTENDVVVTFKQSYETTNNNGTITHTLIGLRDKSENKADGKGGSVFFDISSTIANNLTQGTVLNPGWKAKVDIYKRWVELVGASNVTTQDETVMVNPFDRTGVTLTDANQSEYVILNNVTISNSGKTATTTGDAKATYTLYDQFKLGYEDGNYEYVKGVVCVYNSTIEVLPLELKKAKVATPTFDPRTGEYTTIQNVTIACDTEEATIHYTTDGTEPTAESPVYSQPIVVNDGTTTIKAIAMKAGMTNSEVATATYTVNLPKLDAPTFDHESNTYDEAFEVTITAAEGATIHYTTDGTEPTAESTVYNARIPVNKNMTIKAIAVKEGYKASDVATAEYQIKVAPPTFSPESGTYTESVLMKISCETDGATIQYTLNPGENDWHDGNIVTWGLVDGKTRVLTVYARAKKDGMTMSEVASVTYTIIPAEPVATPTFSLVAGSYGEAQQLTISCATEGATILYSTDGGSTWTAGNTVNVDKDMTIMAKAEKDGYTNSATVTATYIIDIPEELLTITPFKGYYQIKNNGNGMYANIAGRKTLNFTDAPADKAGTVIWLETNDKGQVQSIRSQAADLQGYANRAMRYVPEMVNIVVNKINEMDGIEDATGAGSVLGENGLGEIMEAFNEGFDHHLYVEQAQGGWRLYGKTPSMQHVVDFYREHKSQVEAKLPKLEQFINDALDKLISKIGGSSVFTDFSLHQIWEKMGGTLTEPVDDASIMAFYREVLNNKNYVWDFAYQTAQIYWGNVKNHPRYDELKAQLGDYADYIDEFVTQVRPDFKYYVIQRGNEPDYISQGNGEIINNDPRTLWTLEPRTDFTVNIAGEQFGCPYAGGVGGYATTNYTDFAYTVPEGVTAYKVASVENGVANLQALSGVIPAQTPVLLMAKEAGDYVLTLSTEAGTAVEGNLLVGPDYLIKTYELKTPMVESLFSLAKGVLGEQLYNQYVAQYEYLQLLYAGTVNNKYFWGLTRDDVMKCLNANGDDCVVRDLSGSKFIDNRQVKTNKAFLVSETDQTITISTLRGDVNHDGYVNIDDVTALIDYLLEVDGRACPYCANVNCDSTVNIVDVTYLIDILLGNISPYAEGGNGN